MLSISLLHHYLHEIFHDECQRSELSLCEPCAKCTQPQPSITGTIICTVVRRIAIAIVGVVAGANFVFDFVLDHFFVVDLGL